jgi:hypothetical protein
MTYDPRKNSADGYALALETARNDYLDNRRDGETAEQYRNRVATPISLVRVNNKDAAAKGKPELSLIPTVALVEEAKALMSGADKYGAYNYLAAPVQASTYIDAAFRHLRAWMDGEDLDASGANHLGHARASLAIVLDAAAGGTLVDDRPHVLISLYQASTP